MALAARSGLWVFVSPLGKPNFSGLGRNPGPAIPFDLKPLSFPVPSRRFDPSHEYDGGLLRGISNLE
jgi:hypothetical protein